MIGVVTYLLCALVSLACAIMLTRGYRQSRMPLLYWSSFAFMFLALNNALLVVDMLVLPGIDLRFWRALSALLGLGVLAYGFIREAR